MNDKEFVDEVKKAHITGTALVFNEKKELITEVLPSHKEELRVYLDRDFINERVDACKNNVHKMFMRLMWITGIRVSEALGLRKRDINFEDYLITIRWLKSRKYKYRVLPFHPCIKDVLELFVANMKADDLIFPFSRQRAFQITKEHLGCSPHKLRHSFAVNWVKSGGRIEILCRIMGHSNIKTTMEYYKLVPVDQGKELIKIRFR